MAEASAGSLSVSLLLNFFNIALISILFSGLCTPEIDPDQYAPCVALKSVHNTVIESLWRWFESSFGHILKSLILKGAEDHIFQAHCLTHVFVLPEPF